LNRPSRIVTADKIAKAQAKAERDAKKAERIAKEKANAPTKSGEFLTSRMENTQRLSRQSAQRFTRVVQPSMENSEICDSLLRRNTRTAKESILEQEQRIAKDKEKADIICQSLAEKNGVSFDQQLKILQNKYQKRGNQ
jgi:uncharacterized protein YaaW (UPF0174 family)